MRSARIAFTLALCATLSAVSQERTLAKQDHKHASSDAKLPGVGAAMQAMIERNEIAGAVTAVVTKDKVIHFETTGLADVAAKRADGARQPLLDRLDDQAGHRRRGADAAG